MTPTVFIGRSTAKDCQISAYRPAAFISSRTIASASLRMSHLFFVTSPIILMARPGPGKGCLPTISSVMPISRPKALTSSLKSSLQEPAGGVHPLDVHVERLPEGRLDLVCLALPQDAVIDENAGEVVADGLVHQKGRHCRVHPAADAADDSRVPYLLTARRYRRVKEPSHIPCLPIACAHPHPNGPFAEA